MLLLNALIIFAALATTSYASTSDPTDTSTTPSDLPTPPTKPNPAAAPTQETTTSTPAGPISLCAPPLTPCGTLTCYDPATHTCCPDSLNICETSQTCVSASLPDATLLHGCCPAGHLACGTSCFATSTSKCCAQPGGAFGFCPAGVDCCGDMCCDEGEVCANGMSGPMCWPGVAPSDWWSSGEGTATSESMQVMQTIGPVREDCCGYFCCETGQVCANTEGGPKCFPNGAAEGSSASGEQTTSDTSVGASATSTLREGGHGPLQVSTRVSATATASSSGSSRRVVPWLLCLLIAPIPVTSGSFTLSPVNFGNDTRVLKRQATSSEVWYLEEAH